MHSVDLTGFAYVGTYTDSGSEGIYLFALDFSSGRLVQTGTFPGLSNPSYLTISADNHYLYAVSETQSHQGEPGGAAAAFAIHPQTGGLTWLNTQPTHGKDSCHLCVDKANRVLYTANYSSGSLTIFPLLPDGKLDASCIPILHQGSGPNRERQEMPHVHCVVLTPEEHRLCAVDLGTDQVMAYDTDSRSGGPALTVGSPLTVEPGSGPRHLEFHPHAPLAYLITELSNEIVVLQYRPTDPVFKPIQRISTLPVGYAGSSTCAAVHVSPDGRYLYASNRGHDSLAVFAIDPVSGKLEPVCHTASGGRTPRDFAIDPSGRYLYIANQDSDSLVSFAIREDSGRLEPLGDPIRIPKPVCIRFAGTGQTAASI